MRESNPKVRQKDLLLESLPDELLVYDQTVHKAHCLNAPAAAVFKYADGTRSMADIARAASDELHAAVGEDVVWAALEEIDEHGLLETALPLTPEGAGRRGVLAAGAAAVLVPLVVAITAPTPAYAQSILPTGPVGPTGIIGPTGPVGTTGSLPLTSTAGPV
jgi:hypothetical protein